MEGKGKIRLRYHFDQQPDFPSSEKTERRSFLRLVRKTIADMGREVVSFQLENSEETKNPHSKEQVRNTAALQYALSITPDERIYERDVLLSYFFSVSTNEQCDCCPSCTGMCPTGALKRKKENDKKLLTFTSARCNGCGLCVNFCRKSALTLKAGFSGDPNITLRIA
jgi:Pyruvate/2-oxoacid:ferredoxin oxidoreductase delta subunit